jgi:multiple sugar transport system permease protein
MGWLNTYWPLIVPTFLGFGLRGGLFVFVFRQFFRGLPSELEDAARIDGCGYLRTYWNIILPISGAAVVVTIVLSMAWHWNDYYEPTIYLLGAPEKRMLPAILPSLYEFISGIDPEELGLSPDEVEETFNAGFVMAATAMVMAPVMAAYLVLQRRFMASITRTGLTE